MKGNDPYSGLPWTAKAIAVVGIPGAFAAVMLYYFIAVWGSNMSAQTMMLNTHVESTKEYRQELLIDRTEHREEIRMMSDVLKQICANGAKNVVERNHCFPPKVEIK